MPSDRPVADQEHIGVHRAGYRSDCPACIANDERISDRPDADREPLSRREVRRLAVEAFIDAHYEVRCDGALELAWYEAHPEQAAAIVRALEAVPHEPVTGGSAAMNATDPAISGGLDGQGARDGSRTRSPDADASREGL